MTALFKFDPPQKWVVTWRIIPVSKLVVSNPHLEAMESGHSEGVPTTPGLGDLLTMFINHLVYPPSTWMSQEVLGSKVRISGLFNPNF